MLTGVSGLRLYGFRSMRLQDTRDDEAERPEPVHVLIPHGRRRLSTGYVRIERTHRLPEPGPPMQGLAVAPLVRAIGDATTLADPAVMGLISSGLAAGAASED